MHFGLVCPPFPSHARAFEALALALAQRGHRSTFLMNAGCGEMVRAGPWDVREAGLGAAPRPTARAGSTGLFGILRTVAESAERTQGLVSGGVAVLREAGVEALVGDQMEPATGLLATHLGLPFVSLASALPIDPDAALPPPYLDWPFDDSVDGLKRNRGGRYVAGLLMRRQAETIRRCALSLGLQPLGGLEDWLSPLGTISQTLPAFDFPYGGARRILGVGPLRSPGEGQAPLPFVPDPARPLVFASLGTLQGHRVGLFRVVAEACRRLDLGLVVAHCGRLTAREAATIDADLVTDFLPQRTMLRAASVCVTHGGLNTALDAMEAGVPALAIPIAYDQPGVAARLVHHGAGLKLSRRRLTPDAVERALVRLLGEAEFRSEAAAIGAAIGEAGGATRAAEAVEAWVTHALVTTWPPLAREVA
ncbi:nucleotide disphospho-sugar-binding domain-containing protein [Aureimonas phyllosphaerae]|uniref:nucleotide disphospho-sugar-binding domain-containing protein n=1 Tax=Aureimonas phyllosphaerae TaxID=1166078 RepID=UPI003A5B9FD3